MKTSHSSPKLKTENGGNTSFMMNKLNNVFGYATRTLARTGLVSVLALTLLAPPLTVAQANTVTLNFVNADIGEVARAVAVMTGRNLVVDPRVRGNINMVSERPVSTSEAYDQFLTAVRLQGYTVVETAGIYKLVPESDAKQQANTLIGTAKGSDFRSATQIRGNQIATQVFPLAYENANTMVGVLRPLMGPNSNINVNPSNNSLIITDYADNLQRVAKLIASQDVAKGTDLEIVPLQSANANDLAPLIIKLSESSGSGGTNAPMILADTRSNSIILRAGNPSQMMQLKDLIQKLDREFQGGAASTDAVTPGVYVIKLKNGEATKIATTLRSVLPQGIAAISQPGTTATSNVQIQADAATNSLIITAPDSQYRQLKAVIEKLDARPAQVFIESLIAEVNSDKVTDFGIQWQSALGQKGDGTVGILGSAFGSGTSNITGLSLANKQQLAEVSPQGLNFGLFKKEGGIYVLGMLARLLESTGDGNILATPNVLTLDNEESRVIVGQNVPFVTGQYTSTGNNSVTNPFQTIERKDVGLTLRVKPQISENGAIRLKIYQESSSVDSTSNEGLITNKRSIETNVIVDDGAIVVLGGLLDDRSVDTESKVPVLGDIPGLGSLFKSENRKRKKTNLMIFLRPTIVRTEQETRALSTARYEDLRVQQLANQPARHLIFDNKPVPVLPAISEPTATPAAAAAPFGQQSTPPARLAPATVTAAPVVPNTSLKASSGLAVPQKSETQPKTPEALQQLFRNPGKQP